MDTENADDLMSAREAAALLGVAERTLWRFRKAGKLEGEERVVRIEQTQPAVVFRRGDVLRLKQEREKSPAPEA